ncbi:glucuronyl hydrolase [bacterium]|nr:MAG: glucuronyl hydrolase [bacterium]
MDTDGATGHQLGRADRNQLEQALQLAVERAGRDAAGLAAFPHITRDGAWLVSEHGRWTAGFFVGMLWLASMVEENGGLESRCRDWCRRLAPRADDRTTHDMGFLFEPSFVRGFNITGERELQAVALRAADSLASRYRPLGRFIPAWDPSEGDQAYAGLAIVDTVMNLPLLLWAARVRGESRLDGIGRAVAETIARQHVREDGSTVHVIHHDPADPARVRPDTHQGASATSCWTRGQAWALYGFTRLGVLAGRADWIELAGRLADTFLERMAGASLAPWDFDRAGPGEPRDAAASAIAASGLLELSRAAGHTRYAAAAVGILTGLVKDCLQRDPQAPGLLRHVSVDVPRGSGIDVSTMYGDHYFMEALVKLLRPSLWDLLGCVVW